MKCVRGMCGNVIAFVVVNRRVKIVGLLRDKLMGLVV